MNAVLLSALLLLASQAVVADDYIKTPDGVFIHKTCHFEHANGERVDVDKQSPCVHAARMPLEQLYAMDSHVQITPSVTSMNASWVVPSLPKTAGGQTVYFWPGFKSSQPEMGLPVLQPVLQYGQHGKSSWELQSWFVWGNNGVSHVAPAFAVKPGDKITSYMSYNAAAKEWTVFGAVGAKSSNLKIAYSQAGNTDYTYAMLVNENIMPQGLCGLYPAPPNTLTFDGVSVNGLSPTWTLRENGKDCGQAVAATSDTVTMSWHN